MATVNREEWIDVVKGFAAISVILLHASTRVILTKTFAYVHIWQAVPLFVFVSFYLFFKKLDNVSAKEWYNKQNQKKVLMKVILSFLLLEVFFALNIIHYEDWTGLRQLVRNLGLGHGSYYPYVYCQLWLLAPPLYFILLRMKQLWGGGDDNVHFHTPERYPRFSL